MLEFVKIAMPFRITERATSTALCVPLTSKQRGLVVFLKLPRSKFTVQLLLTRTVLNKKLGPASSAVQPRLASQKAGVPN